MTRIGNFVLQSVVGLAVSFILVTDTSAQDGTFSKLFMNVTIEAGRRPRKATPIRFEVPEYRVGPLVHEAIQAGGSAALAVTDVEDGTSSTLAQVERIGDGPRLRVTLILPKEIPSGGKARLTLTILVPRELTKSPAWSFDETKPGSLDLKYGGRPVFRYNSAPVSSPNYKEIQNRDGYIHPAYSPSGALITGDFSSSHPHHRGFFLAYEKTKTGGLTPDFWNIHHGTGKIYVDGIDRTTVGPVTARFSARHRWEAKDKGTGSNLVVLRERWEVETYAIPGSPYWLFDITSTQQAVDRSLEVLPYRYGGMAYRGPEPFVKGMLDVLTSEGKHRKDGDQKPARWVDLTGPVADGSNQYAGAMIADHPSNPHYPNVARIHPTTLPFFGFVPASDKPLTIAVDTPTVFCYRILIHDGHPDPMLDEQVAGDFAEPPVVVVE